MTGVANSCPVPDEMLSAYVDGALSPDDASRVARAAAAVPEVARRIAVLHHLKAHVAGLSDDVVLINYPCSIATQPRRNGARVGMAALLVAVCVTFSVFWVAGDRGGEASFSSDVPRREAATAAFVAAHDSWIAADGSAHAPPQTTDWLQDLIAPTGLALVRHTVMPLPSGMSAQHFAFVGPSGCRLSLFETVATDDTAAVLEVSIREGLLAASWTRAGRGYAIFARDMHEGRFLTIAAALHQASRDRGPSDEQLLSGLQQARQPCIG